MKKKILHNPTDKDIVDYKIEEAETDQDGNVMYDEHGTFKGTGRTFEWTVKAGDTLEFPDYVADYLFKIYEFLKLEDIPVAEVTATTATDTKTVSKDTAPLTEEKVVSTAAPTEAHANCRHCGFLAKTLRGLGLHIAAKHPEKL